MEDMKQVIWGTYLMEGIECDVTPCLGNRAVVRVARRADLERAEVIAGEIASALGWDVLVSC